MHVGLRDPRELNDLIITATTFILLNISLWKLKYRCISKFQTECCQISMKSRVCLGAWNFFNGYIFRILQSNSLKLRISTTFTCKYMIVLSKVYKYTCMHGHYALIVWYKICNSFIAFWFIVEKKIGMYIYIIKDNHC